VIYVPRVEALSATTFAYTNNSGFPYEDSGGVCNTITVNLDQNFVSVVDFTDQQVANSSAATFQNFASVQGGTLAKTMLQRIWTLFTTVNFGLAALNVSIANYNRAGTVSIRTVMAKRDVNPEEVSLIVNEDVMHNFLSDSNVYQAYAFGGSEAIRTGNIPALAGMKIYHSNIMPTNGISLVGVAAHPNSVALAMRYLEPSAPEAYVVSRRLVDPSGLVLGYRRHYAPGKGKHFVNMEVLFGMAVGISVGLGILTRTD